jgi:hypothetical protein
MEQDKLVSTDEFSVRAGDSVGVYRLGGPQDIPIPGDVYAYTDESQQHLVNVSECLRCLERDIEALRKTESEKMARAGIKETEDAYIQARRNSMTANSVICMNASLRVRELQKEADRMREIIRKTKEACGVSE